MSTTSAILTSSDGSRVIWGFMFENTLFTEFERRNHPIIEAAYRQRKKKHSSHHITIIDSHLPKPGKAKVYFGVAQNHLRMPGTRYYVTRQVIRPSPPSPPFTVPTLMPSPTSTFSTTSFSSMDTPSLSRQPVNQILPHHQHYDVSSYSQQQTLSCQQRQNIYQQNLNSTTLDSVLSDDVSLLNLNQTITLPSTNYSLNHTENTSLNYYDNNFYIPDFNALNATGDSTWLDDTLLLESPYQLSWFSPTPVFDFNQQNLTNNMYI